MESPSTQQLTSSDVQLLMENALLKNNEHQMKEIRAEIENSSEKIAHAVNSTTSPLLKQLLDMNTAIAHNSTDISTLKTRLGGMWGKLIGIAAAGTAIGGFLGIIVEYMLLAYHK